MNDPFATARAARVTHARRHAELAISIALLVCEARAVTETQLADLADAVEALRDRQYHVATILAEAAIERRNRDGRAIRPPSLSRSIAEIRAMFATLQDFDRR
jgi:hypothetical protein